MHNGEDFYLRRSVPVSKLSVLEFIGRDNLPWDLNTYIKGENLRFEWVDVSNYTEEKPKTMDFLPKKKRTDRSK